MACAAAVAEASKKTEKGAGDGRATLYVGRVTPVDIKASGERYAGTGVDALTMDMWVDGDGRAKPFRMRGEGDKGPPGMTVAALVKDAQG
ncbi:hypothetical protein [Streptomyces sp. NPDC101455]|uniref:hypothetical protein n=1 Tax=Streptomyces sp. NPDC101455 TaxID=3366142 RepID=UPI00380B7C35